MAFRKSRFVRFDKIFVGALGILFGIVTLVMAYRAISETTESRSKAAENQSIYRSWEFNGRDTEGWNAIAPSTASARNGAFVLSVAKGAVLPTFRNTDVSTKLPQGAKAIIFSMAVDGAPVAPTAATTGKPETWLRREVSQQNVGRTENALDDAAFAQAIREKVVCTMEAKLCPDGSSVGRSGRKCEFLPCPTPASVTGQRASAARKFVAMVSYQLQGKKRVERPVIFSGAIDGKFQTYTVAFPDIAAIDLKTIRVTFLAGLKAGEVVSVDWIRLSGTNIASTPTPTPTPTVTPTVSPTSTPIPTPVATTNTPTPSPTAVHSLALLSPNGGEILKFGQTYTITWSSSRTFTNLALQYATEGGFVGSISNQVADTGSFTWQVNPVFGKTKYRIFLYGHTDGYMTANDVTDGYFTVE